MDQIPPRQKRRPRRPRRDPGAMRDIGLYTSIPIMLGVGPGLGWWLGKQAGEHWGAGTWWEVGGVLFGLAAAIRQVYKILKQASDRA